MPIDIVDNFKLGTDIPLDVRYQANTYMDVSAYWYPGMQVYQYSDQQIWYADNSLNWSTMKQTGPINIDEIIGGTNWTNPSGDKIKGGSF